MSGVRSAVLYYLSSNIASFEKLKSAKVRSLTIEGGSPKTKSLFLFLLNFLCGLSFNQFVEKLYIGVAEGSISPSKSLCNVGVRLGLIHWHVVNPGQHLTCKWGSKFGKYFFLLKIHFERFKSYLHKKKGDKILSRNTIVKVRGGRVGRVWSKTILSRFLIFGIFPYCHFDNLNTWILKTSLTW